MLARWYETFLTVCQTAQRRGYGIACHPSQKSEIQDMMERVYEDELWNRGDPPPLLVHSSVPRGTYQMVDEKTLKLISLAAGVKSNTGMGRLTRLWTPRAGLRKADH